MHVKSLRAKLGDDAKDPRHIRTETGLGYRWVSSPAPSSPTGEDDLGRRLDAVRDGVRRWAGQWPAAWPRCRE